MSKLFIALALTLFAGFPAFAQGEGAPEFGDVPQAVAEALAQQPALGQADINAYIQIIPELPTLLSDPQSAAAVAAAHNLDQARFSYIMAKLPLAMAIASGFEAKTLGLETLPQALHPSEAELAVVKANLEALNAAASAAVKTLTETPPGAAAAEE